MTLTDWVTLALLCLSGAASPGPSLAVVLHNTIRGGRAQGIAAAVGHGLGVGIYAFGAVAGFTALVAAWPSVQRGLTLGGGAFLVFMGVSSLRARPATDTAPPRGEGFVGGFLMAFLNPKIAVFFLALLGSFVPEGSSFANRAGIAAMAMGIDTGWYVLAATVLAGTGADRWLAARGRAVSVAAGVFFVVVGVLIAGRAVL